MNVAAVNQELQRLRVYQDDLRKNLPSVVLESDSGYKTAQARIDELNQQLEVLEQERLKREEQERIAIEQSSRVMAEITAILKSALEMAEKRRPELHPSGLARYLELTKVLKKEIR